MTDVFKETWKEIWMGTKKFMMFFLTGSAAIGAIIGILYYTLKSLGY